MNYEEFQQLVSPTSQYTPQTPTRVAPSIVSAILRPKWSSFMTPILIVGGIIGTLYLMKLTLGETD